MLLQASAAAAGLQLGEHARWQRTIVVCPGATPAESGANLRHALASVTASAEQPWLIRIEPGTYDLGEGYLQTKPHVDIAGAGEGATVIQAREQGGGAVRGSDHVEIRALSVVNLFDGDNYCAGIETLGSPFRLRNVRVAVTGYCRDAVGIDSRQSEVDLVGVSVQVAGAMSSTGIDHSDAAARFEDVDVAANGIYGVAEVVVNGAPAAADVFGIKVFDAGTLQRPVRLDNVRVVADGDASASGILLSGAVVEADRVRCRGQGAVDNCGLKVQSSAAVYLSNLTAAGDGGNLASGVCIDDADATLVNVTAAGAGGFYLSSGILARTTEAARTLRIDHCDISGGKYGISVYGTAHTFHVGASRIAGAVSPEGTWHCVHCSDGDNNPLSGTCR